MADRPVISALAAPSPAGWMYRTAPRRSSSAQAGWRRGSASVRPSTVVVTPAPTAPRPSKARVSSCRAASAWGRGSAAKAASVRGSGPRVARTTRSPRRPVPPRPTPRPGAGSAVPGRAPGGRCPPGPSARNGAPDRPRPRRRRSRAGWRCRSSPGARDGRDTQRSAGGRARRYAKEPPFDGMPAGRRGPAGGGPGPGGSAGPGRPRAAAGPLRPRTGLRLVELIPSGAAARVSAGLSGRLPQRGRPRAVIEWNRVNRADPGGSGWVRVGSWAG